MKSISRSRYPYQFKKWAAGLLVVITLAACSGQPQNTANQTAAPAVETSEAPVEAAAATLAEVSPPASTAEEDTIPETGATAESTPAQPATAEDTPNQAAGPRPAEQPIACTSPADPSPAMTEGPYYTPNTPERNSLLEPGIPGTKLILTGYVLNTGCQPIANAWLDFWQTDGNGEYDNAGFRLRGHQFTDEAGRYQLETVVPGLYPGRTAHIHVKVQAPDGPVLTTQLFVPGEPGNDRDSIFSEALLMNMQDAQDGKQATFNFILAAP
jgi:protocatechuate 3,4-dioxygenase beta subunit